MYILYWYVLIVTVLNVVAEVYLTSKLAKPKTEKDKFAKLCLWVGLVFRQTAFVAFLVLVYPALEYLK